MTDSWRLSALDTETTGVDFYHGAKPYFVTMSNGTDTRYWEWLVDPLTREPQIPQEDLDEILKIVLEEEHIWVLQNTRFDVAALASVDKRFHELWPWDRTKDTLLAGHLLASNRPHDLTSMVIEYLDVDIGAFDRDLKEHCTKARRHASSKYPDWQIAQKGRPDMPSAKEQVWKLDGWLPKAIAVHEELDEDHPWHNVLADYANADSASTVELYRVQSEILKQRGLD